MFLAFLGGCWVLFTGGEIYIFGEVPSIVRIGAGLFFCYLLMATTGVFRSWHRSSGERED